MTATAMMARARDTPLSTVCTRCTNSMVATMPPGPASSGVPSGTKATLALARSVELGSSVLPVSSCSETSRSSRPPAPSRAGMPTWV